MSYRQSYPTYLSALASHLLISTRHPTIGPQTHRHAGTDPLTLAAKPRKLSRKRQNHALSKTPLLLATCPNSRCFSSSDFSFYFNEINWIIVLWWSSPPQVCLKLWTAESTSMTTTSSGDVMYRTWHVSMNVESPTGLGGGIIGPDPRPTHEQLHVYTLLE